VDTDDWILTTDDWLAALGSLRNLGKGEVLARIEAMQQNPSRFHVLLDDSGIVTGTMQIEEDVNNDDRP